MKLINLISVIILALCFTNTASSQTLAEWIRQKRTQRNYLIQQIAAAQAYAQQLSSGYRILEGGLSIIDALQRGEFDLHRAFFDYRKSPSSFLRADPRIDQIMVLQRAILHEQRSCARALSKGFLPDGQFRYVRRVLSRIDQESRDDLSDLSLLLEQGALEMDDADRLARLQGIYQQTLERHTFIKNFVGAINMQLVAKQLESREIRNSIILHD